MFVYSLVCFLIFVFSVILKEKNTAKTRRKFLWEKKRGDVVCEPDQ